MILQWYRVYLAGWLPIYQTTTELRRNTLPNWERFAVVGCLFLAVCLLFPSQVAAQTEDISILLSTETPSFNVGDRIALDVTVRHPEMYRVIAPDIIGEWGELEVLDVVPLAIEPNGDGSETTRMRLMMTAWETRTYATPQLTLSVSNAEGDLLAISAESINLTVVSVLDPQDLALRDIKPQAMIEDLSPLLRRLMIGIMVALVIAGASIYLFYRNRKIEEAIALEPVADLRPANMIALQEIDEVEQRNLLEEGRFNEHYTQIADALRRYLERGYSLSAMEATTFEIRRMLRGESQLDSGTRQKLISILQSADLVKFARAKPDLKAAQLLPGRARAFVRDSHAQLQPEPPVDSEVKP